MKTISTFDSRSAGRRACFTRQIPLLPITLCRLASVSEEITASPVPAPEMNNQAHSDSVGQFFCKRLALRSSAAGY